MTDPMRFDVGLMAPRQPALTLAGLIWLAYADAGDLDSFGRVPSTLKRPHDCNRCQHGLHWPMTKRAGGALLHP